MKEIKISSPRLAALYENIGGEAALGKILLRFYEKMSKDLLIGFFFDGKDLVHISGRQKEFLMRTWGVSASYSGKAPAEAHAQLPPILSGHFDRRLVLLEETLREFNVSDDDIQVWVSFEAKFRQAVQHS